jgi:hypothetical protein
MSRSSSLEVLLMFTSGLGSQKHAVIHLILGLTSASRFWPLSFGGDLQIRHRILLCLSCYGRRRYRKEK